MGGDSDDDTFNMHSGEDPDTSNDTLHMHLQVIDACDNTQLQQTLQTRLTESLRRSTLPSSVATTPQLSKDDNYGKTEKNKMEDAVNLLKKVAGCTG